MSKVLTERQDIRYWATARAGNPMIMEMPPAGGDRSLLQITFGQHALNAERNEGPDVNPYGGWALCDWEEWFEELEKQGLAIKVNEDEPGSLSSDFKFVSRHAAGNLTTDAARQPANITIKSPDPDDRAY